MNACSGRPAHCWHLQSSALMRQGTQGERHEVHVCCYCNRHEYVLKLLQPDPEHGPHAPKIWLRVE